MNKFAMVTRADKNCKELIDVTHGILKDYAGQWGCDFIVLDDKEAWMTDYELAHYRILNVAEILKDYERVLVIDSDIVIMPGCPNPFEIVPEDKIGSIYEDVGSRESMRKDVIKLIQDRHGDVGWKTGYINTGFFVASRIHADIFQKIDGKLWVGFGYDDALVGYNIHKLGHEVHELPYQFNHMSMFSEPWNNNASRFDSWIIHYAGNAQFPDDLSGRGNINNNIHKRLQLIKSDIDRITEGLMTFKGAVPTSIQGVGSRCLDVKIGVQEKPVVIKVPIDYCGVTSETRLYRELHVFNLNIPNIVTFMGMAEDKDLGKFIILEKLLPLPFPMTEEQLIDVATKSLIAQRQLYKHGIPWICKIEHIMVDEAGDVKLLDFNDEPWDRDMPFYAKDGKEAIIMNGECDRNGLYKGKHDTPWSGWKACISFIANENKLNVEKILSLAEDSMWAYEYQNLKNVHQPIHIERYNNVLRTETERPDPNYGKLVPANRQCVDRARIIRDSLGNIADFSILLDKPYTWLDIGSNVGWFCHAFDDYFRMVGLEADKDMCEFAEMQGEYLGSDARFINKTLDLDTAVDLIEYDVISALSVIHWMLITPPEGSSQTSVGEGREYFLDLLTIICNKVRKMFILEFPPYCYKALGVLCEDEFITLVRKTGNFKEVTVIGISDARRPILRCLK